MTFLLSMNWYEVIDNTKIKLINALVGFRHGMKIRSTRLSDDSRPVYCLRKLNFSLHALIWYRMIIYI